MDIASVIEMYSFCAGLLAGIVFVVFVRSQDD